MNRATAAVVVERDYVGLSPASSRDSGGGAASAPEKNEEGRICELEEEEEEEEGDLELGLSLGAKRQLNGGSRSSPWGEYCRILTAKDFPSVGSRSPSASSVSSSSPASVFASVASDATAGSVSPPSQAVIGWPPIRTFRMNTLVNQKNNEAICSKGQEKNGVHVASTRFVKVNMDGDPIGRKVDLNAHLTYETLALSLEAMFEKPTIALGSSTNGSKASKLLDGSSEFALTYEDKDGDWMLVGDVPWGMFLETVKRLRIMRTPDANGLSSRFRTSGHS